MLSSTRDRDEKSHFGGSFYGLGMSVIPSTQTVNSFNRLTSGEAKHSRDVTDCLLQLASNSPLCVWEKLCESLFSFFCIIRFIRI